MLNHNEVHDEIKAERTPFLKFYTSDWLTGTIGLTIEQRGFYHECLIRMWERKSGLPSDEKWLARSLQCDPRMVRRLLAELTAEKKLRTEGGLVVNDRMMREIATHHLRSMSAKDRPKIANRSPEDRPKIAEIAPENQIETMEHPSTQNAPIYRSQKTEDRKKQDSPSSALPVSEPARSGGADVWRGRSKELFEKLATAANGSLYPLAIGLHSVSEPLAWIAEGADIDLDVLPVVEAVGHKARPNSIRSWSYFAPMVAEAKGRREKGLPAVSAEAAPKRSDWATERKQRAQALIDHLNAGAAA